jgi:hypothetical protein
MMMRTPMKPSSKPMARGTPMKKATRKARPKIDGIDYLALCRGQECYLRLPMVAMHDPSTVVPAHSNQSKHGKGMGIKANDIYTVPACHTCHAELDQGKSMNKAEKFSAWDKAFDRWSAYREGLLRGSM